MANSKVVQFLVDTLGLVGLAVGAGKAAAVAELQSIEQVSLRGDKTTKLTPAELAVAITKGVAGDIDFRGEAADSGLDATRFNILLESTGNPPGPETLIAGWRRGLISEADLEHGIRQGYTRSEWIGFYKSLRWLPLNVAEAVTAVVQGHLSHAEGEHVAAEQGVTAADYEVLVATAGNPPGPETSLNMWNRGILTEAETEQALRESRLKDKYIPAYLKLARRRIPARTLNTLLTHGALTAAAAKQQLRELGYSDADVDALIASATAAKAAPHHQLAAGAIKEMYTDRLITRDVAVKDLALAGYDAETASALLNLADVQAVHRLQAQAVTKVRTIYVAHHMDADKASADLGMLGMAPDQIGPTLVLWDLEREANVKTLTEAQLRGAVKKGVIGVGEYIARLVKDGYSDADAQILAASHDLLGTTP